MLRISKSGGTNRYLTSPTPSTILDFDPGRWGAPEELEARYKRMGMLRRRTRADTSARVRFGATLAAKITDRGLEGEWPNPLRNLESKLNDS